MPIPRRLRWVTLLFVGAALPAIPPAAGGTEISPYARYQLQARANFTDSFNLPVGAFWANVTPSLDDEGRVAFHLNVVPGSDGKGIWLGGDGEGEIVHLTPNGSFVSGATLDGTGRVVWEQTFSSPQGIFRYTPGSGALHLTSQPLGATAWSSPGSDPEGRVGYRATLGSGRAYASWDAGVVAIHAAEAGIEPASPYSFLFTPSFGSGGRIAGKVRLGEAGQTGESRPDEIRIFAADGASVLVAVDRDGDPLSPYERFDNSVAMNEHGHVAFIATLVAGGRGVFFWNGAETVTIATHADPEISSIEFFAPSVNALGRVAFRAFDGDGLRAIWAGEGGPLARVVTEHDILPTDLGPARVDEHVDTNPVFGGGPSINRRGDVAFSANLTPPDNNQIEWGSGIFVALSDDIFRDGFESGGVERWSL
jgi:hypothetical protein